MLFRSQRITLDIPKINFYDLKDLSFFAPDREKFPCIDIAYNAIQKGGNTPCIMNAANEIAVTAFLEEKIKLSQIPTIIDKTIQKCTFVDNPSIEDIFSTDIESRKIAQQFI